MSAHNWKAYDNKYQTPGSKDRLYRVCTVCEAIEFKFKRNGIKTGTISWIISSFSPYDTMYPSLEGHPPCSDLLMETVLK